jgi:hypothetical protein
MPRMDAIWNPWVASADWITGRFSREDPTTCPRHGFNAPGKPWLL